MNDYFAFGLGILCAGLGGDLFIRGAVGMARFLRVSTGIIGATVAAFATSSPELSVAFSSAISGAPRISFGDALGSNVLNVALILGITLLFGGIHAPRRTVRRNFLIALLTPVIVGLLALDGRLSRMDGLAMLAGFLAWLIRVTVEAGRERSAAGVVLGERRERAALLYSIAGLALLIAAGYLIVGAATGIAVSLGLSTFFIGGVVVAIGTSVPELATALISKLRGHDEVGLNTILGSNIFNGLLVIGVLVTIAPFDIPTAETQVALLFGVGTVALTLPSKRGTIERWRGPVLLALYVAYVAATASHGG